VYGLNSDQLQIGDVILISSSSKFAGIIKVTTKNKWAKISFSHAGLYMGEGLFIEALTKSGVQITNHRRFGLIDKKNVAVLRYKIGFNEEQKEQIKYIARSYQSQGYCILSAFKSLFKNSKKPEIGRNFCSYLVAKIYREIDLSISEKPDHHISPNDLFASVPEYFEIVTESCITKLNNEVPSQGFEIACLDEGGTTTSKEGEKVKKFIKVSNKIFRRYGLSNIALQLSDIHMILTDSENKLKLSDIDKEIAIEYDRLGINDLNDLSEATYFSIDELKEGVLKFGVSFAYSRLIELKQYYELFNNVLRNNYRDLLANTIVNKTHNLKYIQKRIEYCKIGINFSYLIFEEINQSAAYLNEYLLSKRYNIIFITGKFWRITEEGEYVETEVYAKNGKINFN
jgi:hypothetical protein